MTCLKAANLFSQLVMRLLWFVTGCCVPFSCLYFVQFRSMSWYIFSKWNIYYQTNAVFREKTLIKSSVTQGACLSLGITLAPLGGVRAHHFWRHWAFSSSYSPFCFFAKFGSSFGKFTKPFRYWIMLLMAFLSTLPLLVF